MESDEDEMFIEEEEIDQCIELNEGDAVELEPENEDGAENAMNGIETNATTSQPEIDDACLTFTKHNGEIFSLDSGPADMIVTGGEDDRALIWSARNGNVLFECLGHKDSVVSVKFNSKRTLLATADLSGLVIVWSVENFRVVHSFETGCDVEWALWHHTADILFCGGSDGAVWMWLVTSEPNCKIYSGHGPSCTTGCLLPDGKRLIVGYADGAVKIWDLKDCTNISVQGRSSHTESVTCVACSVENAIAASGSEDGTVNLFHSTTGEQIDTVTLAKRTTVQDGNEEMAGQGNEEASSSASVETLAFSPSGLYLAVGSVTGDFVVWDVGARRVRKSFVHKDGVVKCLWRGDNIFTCCLDGVIRLWSNLGDLVTQWHGHSGAVLDFCLAPDAKYLVSASADQTAKVYDLANLTAPAS